MVQLGDVIEIESSPEPNPPPPPPHSQSRLATPNGAKSRNKGKGKATPRLPPASSVIELTDSEPEDDKFHTSRVESQPVFSANWHAGPGPASQDRKKKPSTIPAASSDNISTLPKQDSVLASSSGSGGGSGAASGSGTVAGPSMQKPTPATDHQPLFLTIDEEHEPSATTTLIERVEATVTDDLPIEPPIPALITGPEPQILILTNSQPLIPPDPVPELNLDPTPIKDMDPTSTAVAQILEIIPNVEPTYLLELIQTHLPAFSVFREDQEHEVGDGRVATAQEGGREATVDEQVQGVVGHVLHLLFEEPDYPKAELRKGKGKRVAQDEQDAVEGNKGKKQVTPKKPKIDYAIVDRPYPGGPNYFDLALYHLQLSFPYIPKPYLRRQLQSHKSLYAPTHLSIMAAEKSFEENRNQRPYSIKSSRAMWRKPQGDIAFEEEKAWLDAKLAGGEDVAMVDVAEEEVDDAVMNDADDEEEDDGTGIECQCCFADYPFSKMVQCPETHLFCSTCISTYASTQLGTHNSTLTCIHPSSCPLPFPPSELKRILPTKLYELYERLEQQKEIMQAGLVGLEECPFCEWKCVLEVSSEEDKLFRCGNEEGGCGVVSCRGCKKLDHLPKSCKEMEEDKHLDGRHAIEEAMTRALMRNCPKCQKAFIKEQGCNKMSCPNCYTLSCYVCRQVIQGYDHFNQHPGRATTSANSKKCLLWDAVEERHAQEVKEAAEKAMEQYKRDHPDIDESDIKVDLPEVVPPKAPVVAPAVFNNPVAFPGYHPAVYNPNANPIVGHVQLYPHLPHPVQPPPRVHVPHRQRALINRQPQLARQQPQQPGLNTRARTALVEQQLQQVQHQWKKVATKINVQADRARMAEHVRIAEEENRARQRLERIREQRMVARREQQERARLAVELNRQKREDRLRQRQQQLPQVQVQVQLQGQVQPQVQGQQQVQPFHHHHHHVYHHHHHQLPQLPQQPPQQQPMHHFPAVQNPFALPYLGGIQQQQQPQPQPQPQPVMAPPPRVPENPQLRGRGRKKR